MEIDRDGHVMAAVEPQVQLQAKDRLIFVGIVESVVDLQKIPGLTPATDQIFKLDTPAVGAVSYRSRRLEHLSARQPNDSRGAISIDLQCRGYRCRSEWRTPSSKDWRYRVAGRRHFTAGDSSVVWNAATKFTRLLLGKPSRGFQSEAPQPSPLSHRGCLWGMVATVVIRPELMLNAALLAACLALLTGCCSIGTARRSINLQVLFVIAASIGIGNAVQNTGIAGAIARSLIEVAGKEPLVALTVGICDHPAVHRNPDQRRRRRARFPHRHGDSRQPRRELHAVRYRDNGGGVGEFCHPSRVSNQFDGLRPRRLSFQRLSANRAAIGYTDRHHGSIRHAFGMALLIRIQNLNVTLVKNAR